jgi:enoyl-CoA hydratase/carnithine racemase
MSTDAYDFTGLHVAVEGGVARVVIDHPPINLFDLDLMVAFDGLGRQLAADDDVRVVIVRSADADFWIAHADVGLILGLPRDPDAPAPTELGFFHQMVERFRTMPKTTIAEIAGIARGGGAEFAASFDLRIAGDGAVLGQPEVALGILPGGGGTQRLARLVGRSRALQIVLGCGDVDATTAAAWGWVNEVVAGDDLVGHVDALARRIASFPAVAIAEAKASVLAADPDPTPGLLQEEHRFNRLLAEPEAIDRMERFLAIGGQTRAVELDLEAVYDQLT